MELHRDPYRPVADGLATPKVSEALPDSGPNGRSQDQPDSDKDLDEVLLLNQVSHRGHATDTQIEDLEPPEHSLVKGISSAPFRSASQQRHFKAIFTRPVSANGEIQTGFTFGKAPSPKALSLTGGRGPATTGPQNIVSARTSQSSSKGSQVQHHDRSGLIASGACDSVQGRSNSRPCSRSEMPVGDFEAQSRTTAPQSHLESGPRQDLHEHTLDHGQHNTHQSVQDSPSAISNDILPILRTAIPSYTSEATPLRIGQQRNRSVLEAGRLPNQTSQGETNVAILPFEQNLVARNITESSLRQLRPTHIAQNRTPMPTNDTAQELIQPGGKVTKRRSTSRKKSTAGIAPVQSVEAVLPQDLTTSSTIAPKSEDEALMDALWLRYQTQCHQSKVEQSQLKATAAELMRVKEANGTLQTRLHETQRCAERQQTELDQNKSKTAVWQAKLGKLSQNIHGLSEDHVQLKQDSVLIRKRQEEISKDKADLDVTMMEVHQYAKDRELTELSGLKKEGEHRIRLLEHTVENQERQIEEDWDLLRAERERSLRLEAEILRFSAKHDELMRDVVVHRQTMSAQLSELLLICQKHQAAPKSNDDSQVEIKLEEFATLIKELRDVDKVTPSDFQKLDSSVRKYAQHITRTLEGGIRTIDSSGSVQQAFESEVQSKLNSLSAGLKSEQTLGEQVTELRELKATIRERLQTSEVALAEARQHSLGLQAKEQLLQQRILDLEVETATLRAQPLESLLTVLRQKELEDKHAELLADIAKVREDAREAAKLSQEQAQFLAVRDEHITGLNAQLDELRATLTTLADEKAASEQGATERYDHFRNEVFKAANKEKANILNAHANALLQLKNQKEEADSRADELSNQLTALKNAEVNKSQTSSRLRAQCANLEIQIAEKDSRLASLQEKVRYAENTQSTDAVFSALSEAKDRLTNEVESKQAEIEALWKLNSELVQEHKAMIQSSGASVSDADIRAAQTLTEVQGLLKNFDENVGLANTLADAIAGLSQEMMSAEKDRREVFDARSAEASSNGVSLSNLKPSNTATGSPDKPRRKANRGVPQENVDGAIHTNETNLHSEFVVERSQIEETTFHTRNVKTIFSNPGTDKSCITPFSQVGQIEPAEPSSPLDDISELFPPTPTRSNDQRTYAPLRAARMSDHRAYDGKTQTGESRQSTKSRPARRASVQGPHSLSRRASDNIASKKMPEKRAGISNAARAPTPRADEPTSYSGRTVGFNDLAAAGAAFGRMKTSKAQTMPGSSTQVPPSPRGILNEPNTLKRSAATAGFQAAGPKSRAGKSSKVSESQRNSLGPIIGGSQSPRKATRRNGGRKASKEQEYAARFSQELK